MSKDKKGAITRDVLTKEWTDWVDYWAVDFDCESRKEIIKVAKNLGVEGTLPGTANVAEFIGFEERWTGAYVFENEWQSFRTRQSRDLELTTASHTYPKAGRYIIAVKVADIYMGSEKCSALIFLPPSFCLSIRCAWFATKARKEQIDKNLHRFFFAILVPFCGQWIFGCGWPWCGSARINRVSHQNH